MINTALFHELHAAFKNTAGKVNQMEMFQFLTQKENEIMDSGKASRCINNKASLDEGSIKFLCINEHWDSGSGKMAKAVKNSTDLYAALCKLHKKHFPDLCPPKSCNDALANLARFCFCGDHRRFDPELQFDFHGYFCTARTAKRLINRKDILLEIATALELVFNPSNDVK